MKGLISTFVLLFILYGQSNAQWERTNLPDTAAVTTLAVKDSSIFAGTNGAGIFVSTNNGESWVRRNDGLQDKVVHTIYTNGTTAFAGTETGASVSMDNGLSWNTINSGLSGLGVWSFAVSNFMGDSTLFAGAWSGIYKSTNNGANWEATGLAHTSMPVHSIVIYDPYIFAATLAGGLYKSTVDGISWDNISIEYLEEYSGNVAIIPVYSLVSIDTNIIAGAGPGYFYHASFYNMAFTALSSGLARTGLILCFAARKTTVVAGNSKGYVYLSESSGQRWKLVSPPLNGAAVYSLAFNSSYIFAGTGDGIWRYWYPDTVSNTNQVKELPAGFALEQNYPNPFNPVTKIKYSIPGIGTSNYLPVQLKIYNLLGREVATLVKEQQAPGQYEVRFDGSKLASGVYIYRLQAGSFVSVKKLMLLK